MSEVARPSWSQSLWTSNLRKDEDWLCTAWRFLPFLDSADPLCARRSHCAGGPAPPRAALESTGVRGKLWAVLYKEL